MHRRFTYFSLPLFLLLFLLPACGHPVALKASDPAYVRAIAAEADKAGGREAMVAEVRRIIAGAGQDLVQADGDGLEEQYWEMIGDPAYGGHRQLFSRRVFWDEVQRCELSCGGSFGCSLTLLGEGGKHLLDITGIAGEGKAQRLAGLIKALAGPR